MPMVVCHKYILCDLDSMYSWVHCRTALGVSGRHDTTTSNHIIQHTEHHFQLARAFCGIFCLNLHFCSVHSLNPQVVGGDSLGIL